MRQGLGLLYWLPFLLLLISALFSACDPGDQASKEVTRATVPVDIASKPNLPAPAPSPSTPPHQTEPPVALPQQGFVEISSGSFHSCALRHDGVAVCWGQDRYGQASPPAGERFTLITAGDRHTCARRGDGSNVCWGDVPFGVGIVARKSREATIRSFGAHHACQLQEGGRPRCWILNPSRVIDGPPDTNDRGQASPPEGERFVAISSGDFHTCGLRADGVVRCWGVDVSPREPGPFRDVSSGLFQTCAIRNDGSVTCWGPSVDESRFLVEGLDFTKISVWIVECAIRGKGSVACGRHWEFGHGDTPDDFQAVSVSVGNEGVCALQRDGTAFCWYAGFVPSSFGAPSTYSAIASGNHHVCALRSNGEPVCWGLDVDAPASIPTDDRFISITSGDEHSCALRQDGTPFCWGTKGSRIGLPPPGERFTAISSGHDHACGLREDGSPVCWGSDADGQASPPPGEHLITISSGYNHTCGLREDRSAVCWGWNDFGQTKPPAP